MREECIFYIYSSEDPDYIDKLAWRARHAVYSMRENALEPYKALREIIAGEDIWKRSSKERAKIIEDILRRLGGKLGDTGNRFDFFEEVEATGRGLTLRREIREFERRDERVLTVREGKPVAVFFGESHVRDPLLSLTYTGRVEEVRVDREGMLVIDVGAPSVASRINDVLFEFYLSTWKELTGGALVLETNVDLTQLELKAIDAFQQSTKKIKRGSHVSVDANLEKLAEEKIEEAKRRILAELFGTSQRRTKWW